MTFMRAHGSAPGPTERPWLAGAVSGALGVIVPLGVLWVTGAAQALGSQMGLPALVELALVATVAIVTAGIYARVLGRAANDRRGGWLFGISFGFFVWMLGPTIVLQWITGQPMVVGRQALAVLCAHLLWGLMLGILLPMVHRKVRGRRDLNRESVR